MIIFLFLGVIVVGLAVFGVLLTKELKSGVLGGEKNSGSLPPSGSLAASDSGGILGERCQKLEQLLDEKNRILSQVERELSDERAHRSEFESLKDILQRQIEDLKAQNKKIKEDSSKALQGNADPSANLPQPKVETPAASSEKFDQFFNVNKAPAPALSLHDIFNHKPGSG